VQVKRATTVMKMANKHLSLGLWLQTGYHQRVPVFIWHRLHAEVDRKNARAVFEQEMDVPFTEIRTFFTFNGPKEEFVWHEGEVVLCFNADGKYLPLTAFYSFDHIVEQDGVFYMYVRKRPDRTAYPRPFCLSSSLRREIERHAAQWLTEKKSYLTGGELYHLSGETWKI